MYIRPRGVVSNARPHGPGAEDAEAELPHVLAQKTTAEYKRPQRRSGLQVVVHGTTYLQQARGSNMPLGKRAPPGQTSVVTLDDLQGASSARPPEPDETPAKPLRRSARGRATGLAPVAQELTAAEQNERTEAMGAVLQRAKERATKKARRTKRERQEAQFARLAEADLALREAEEEAELEGYEAEDVQSDEETPPVEIGPVIAGTANAGPRRSGRARTQVVFTIMNGSGPKGSYDRQIRVDDRKQGGAEAVLEDGLVDKAPCGAYFVWAITVIWFNRRTGVYNLCFDFPHKGKQPYQQAGPDEDHIKFDRAWHKDAIDKTEQEEPKSEEEWHLLCRLRLLQNSGRVSGLYRDEEGALVFKLKPVPAEAAGQGDKHQALTVKLKSPSESAMDREKNEEGADWDMQANGIDPTLPSDEQDVEWEDASDTSSSEGDYASEIEESDVESDEEH